MKQISCKKISTLIIGLMAVFMISPTASFTSGEPYYYAWFVAFGMAVNGEGKDFHGAGGVRTLL